MVERITYISILEIRRNRLFSIYAMYVYYKNHNNLFRLSALRERERDRQRERERERKIDI